MSSLPGLTAQVNSMGGCAPADCCAEIAAIKSQLSTINAEIAALKAKTQKNHDADINKLALRLDGVQKDFMDLILLLEAAIEAVKLTAEIAKSAAEAAVARVIQLGGLVNSLSQQVAGLFGKLGNFIASLKPDDGAYALAETALKTASSAGDQAATAILRAKDALSAATSAGKSAQEAKQAASTADNKAVTAAGAAAVADKKAVTAAGAAAEAQKTADLAGIEASAAFGYAEGASDRAAKAQDTANLAVGAAAAADKKAVAAAGAAAVADTKAVAAAGAAGAANTKADTAIGTAGAANTKAEQAVATAGTANTKADQAIESANAANDKAEEGFGIATSAIGVATSAIGVATSATGVATSAIGVATSAKGIGGIANNKATTAEAKSKEALDKANTALNKTLTNNPAPPIIYPAQPVTPSREAEILEALKGTRADVLGLPSALAASTQYRAAAISAAAAGACQSSQPGKCPGGSADQNNQLKDIMDGIGAAVGILNNQILLPMSNVVNTINTKIGPQIVGGLSAWSKGIAEVVNKSQILNVLTYISVLHNAYMLSNALSQTLFSAVGNSLAALGLKDTSTDPNGTPFNVGKIVGDWTETFFKSVFGVATVNGIKSDWKKYSRIYQAAANVLYSVQSIGHSILGALEVVGSHVSKIGNALQKFRVVSERAYSWMNPTPSFQNRFLTVLQSLTEAVSQVDQVASGVLGVQESVTQFNTNTTDLNKSLAQEPGSKQAAATPEAVTVKTDAAAAKVASVSPAIPETAITKPD